MGKNSAQKQQKRKQKQKRKHKPHINSDLKVRENHLAELKSVVEAYQQKKYASCMQCINNLLLTAKEDKAVLANCYFYQGLVYRATHKDDLAKASFLQSIVEYPSPEAYVEIAKIYKDREEVAKQAEMLEKAVAFNQNGDTDYYLELAACYRRMYDDDAAIRVYRALIESDPKLPRSYRNLGLVYQYNNLEHPDFHQLQVLINSDTLPQAEIIQGYSALAKIYNDCDEYEKAFEYTKKVNDYKQTHDPFDLPHFKQKVKVLMETFTPEFFEKHQDCGLPTEKPIFIVGMSRAGKTLIERILNNQPQVGSKDEFALLNRLINKTVGTDELRGFTQRCEDFFASNKAANTASYYLTELERHIEDSVQYITDTTPSNFRYLGFIQVLFPNAKIIYCKRDPLDHCLQIYLKYFVKGHKYSNNLTILGEYYYEYLKIMEHWQKTLLNPMFEVQYESFINNPIEEKRKLFEFLNLEFNPNQDDKLNLTDREIGRWRHFEHHLEPIKRALKL